MPEINENDPKSIKKWQDWAVKNGHMTQEQINTGYGIYGPKTKAAYNKVQQERNSLKDDISYKPSSAINSIITSSPGLTAITEGATGLYHKLLNKIVDPQENKELNQKLSIRGSHRNNLSLNPLQSEIYQSLGNYAIDKGVNSIDAKLINNWYKDVGQHNKSWNRFFNDEDKANWKYSNNKIGLLKKQFNPIERVMNTVGRASIKQENGKYYITDLYDHNKSTYISKDYANNKNLTNRVYGNIVYGLQNIHLSDEDPDWQKQSTKIEIFR